MKISKKINRIMSVSAILALLIVAETGAMHQTVTAAGSAGYQNSQGGNYGGSSPSQNADFGPYMKRMQDKIKANWNPPAKDMDAQIVVKYRIMKDGTLDSYGILSSSGAQDLDNAAIDALRTASPFEPLPPSFNKESILVQFTFDYQKPKSAVNTMPAQPEIRQASPAQQNIPVNNRLATNPKPNQTAIRQASPAQQNIPVNNRLATNPKPNQTAIRQASPAQQNIPVNNRLATNPKPNQTAIRQALPAQQNIPLSNRLGNPQSNQTANRQIVSAPPVRPANNQIASGYQQTTPTNQIAEFQPLIPVNVRQTTSQPSSVTGTPVAPIRIKAGPGEPIQVEKLPPKQKIFPPVHAVQSYEQTPATLANPQGVQKYVQVPGADTPTQVTQVYVPAPPPPEILEPIQPPKAIVPLPPKNNDPRTVAVPPPIRQTPGVDITTYAQGDLLDLDKQKNATDNQGNQQPSYVYVPAQTQTTPITSTEINRIVPPAQTTTTYPEMEYVRFEAVEEVPVNTTLSTGINKVEMPTRRKKLTRPVTEEHYPDVPERRVVPAPTPQGPGVYMEQVRVPDFSEYMRKVERKITRKWHPPLSDYSTKVVVNYVILKDGELGKYYVSESSGNSRMDASAMDALKKAAPFPPLPRGFDQSSVEVKFTFDYNVYKNKSEKRGIKELEEEDL